MLKQPLWFERGGWDTTPFLEAGKQITLPRDTVLFEQDENQPFVYIVIEGRVRIFLISITGTERHLYIVGSGHLVGESTVWTNEKSTYSAATSTPVKLLRVPRDAFREVVMRHPNLIEKMLFTLSQKQASLLLQTELISFLDLEQRVITMLRQLAYEYGSTTEEGVTITIPFTHQELAYVVGSSRVSVSYVMNNLQEKGMIQKQQGLYTLLSARDTLPWFELNQV